MSQLALEAQVVQEISTLLVFLGKLNEAREVFRKYFLQSRVGRDYPPHFTSRQRHAVNRLKKLLGKDNLLTKIRNSFAFHYHETDLSPFLDRVPDEYELEIYLGEPDGNTMNLAHEVLLLSLLDVTGEADPQAARKRIHDFAGEVAAELKHWGSAVQVVAIHKMLGKKTRLQDIEIPTDEYEPQDETKFPFFMSVS